jgi:hypothetical protein
LVTRRDGFLDLIPRQWNEPQLVVGLSVQQLNGLVILHDLNNIPLAFAVFQDEKVAL